MKKSTHRTPATALVAFTGSLALAALAQNGTVPVAHAYQMGSTNEKWGFVSFPVDNLDALTIDKATTSYDDQIGAGEYVDGKYYSFTLEFDFVFGDGLEPSEFVVWNASDFTKIRSIAMSQSIRVVDMAYDHTHNTMYALAEQNRTSNGAIGLTALSVVNLDNGHITTVGLPGDIRALNGYGESVEEHLVALASDPSDGTLYAMGEYRQLYTLDRMTGKATPVGTRNRVAITNDFQTMAFAADGNLYQAQMHPDYEYFMRIDTSTGALYNPVTGEAVTVNQDYTNNAARFPYDPQLTGLWFEGKKYITDVARAVENLSATVAPGDNPNKINLTWTLPSQTGTGNPFTATAVKVYRFGTSSPIAILDGSATSYIDEAAPNGDVTYYVAAADAAGEGFPAWTTVFAGADALKAVTGLTATLDGNEAVVSWAAPTATVNGGYADYDNITYTVTRIMGSERETVASGLKETVCRVALPVSGTYSFEVTPYSCGVEGTPAISPSVTLIGVEHLPYSTGFEDGDGGTLWTAVNNGASNCGWSVVSGYAYQQLSGKFAQFKTGGSATVPADDWFISPGIECPAGNYELTYYACGGSFDTHSYNVFAGPDSTVPSDFTDRIYSLTDEKVYDEGDTDNHYVPVTVSFTITTPGVHRIAFQGIGASTYATLRIDNLSLICTQQTGVDEIPADTFRYDAATRTAENPDALSMSAYDMSGRCIASAPGSALQLAPTTGITVIKAITPAGVRVKKVVVK